MRDNAATARAPALPGVIDSLGTGFSILNRVLWILIIPIVVDVALWLAPRVSVLPLVERWSQIYRTTLSQTKAVAPPDALTPQTVDQATAAVEAIQSVARDFNLLTLFTSNIANATVPSLGGIARLDAGRVVNVDSLGTIVGLALALQMLGVLFGCLYLVLIAHAVTGERLSASTVLQRVGKAWVSVVGYGLIVLAVTLAAMVPIGVLVTLISIVAPVVAGFVYALIFTAAWVIGVWMLLYLYFVAAGIVLGGLGPIKAIAASVGIVRRHFWPALGLVLLTIIISLGMNVIWEQLTSQPWGYGLAAVGNAYIASGLMAAGLYFFWHRSGLAGRASQAGGTAA